MSFNSISGKTFFEKINANYGQNKKSQDSAYENFAGNLKEKAEQEAKQQSCAEVENASESKAAIQLDYRSGKVASELLLERSGRVKASSLFETTVRHISYGESDHVKVCVIEGYTLKAQVDLDVHKIYIEQKNEDGTCLAYEVNPLTVAEDTKNPIEQMALETWEMTRDLFNNGMFTEIEKDQWNAIETGTASGTDTEKEDTRDATTAETFAEMVDQFEAFVEKRIKEGPPKIQIGGSEFSEEEWERLLKKIDEDIDAYKEELRERVRKRQEQEALQRTTGSAAEEISKMAGITETEHALPAENADTTQEPEVTETEAIEGAAEQTQRGTSFFARLSGEKKAPYSYLADESGVILYKGVTFICDDEKQQIRLGDMSDSKNVITIPLAKGGCLKVNRDNIEDLAKAISMFSPEDIGRIMRAIAQDSKVKQVEFEIDERTV